MAMAKADNLINFRWPNDNQRLAIIGRTGTGKTTAGAFQLSMRSFDQMPWIVIDTKRDILLNAIEGAEELNPNGALPDKPGLYMVKSSPRETDQIAIDDLLGRVWEQEDIGIYVDEGYNIPQRENWVGLQTQGRSKRIPMITLSQRPKLMSPFTFSEADHFQVFWLNKPEDRKTLSGYLGNSDELETPLPPFWSRWYNVAQDRTYILRPVPSDEDILAIFKRRLTRDVNQPEPASEIPPIDPGPRFRLI
jgi:hypothetical protein